jgi:hypothetical protein
MYALNDETKSLLFGIQLGHGGERVHLFQHKAKLHLVRFRPPTSEERQEHGCDAVVISEHIGETLQSSLLTGNERWMSELCDFDFCLILDMSGVNLMWKNLRLTAVFKGIALPDPGFPLD